MNERLRNELPSFVVFAIALVTPGLLPRSARGMYDPKHGRWLQRDPAGVYLDAPKASVSTRAQYQDGMNLHQYVNSIPSRHADPYGLKYIKGDGWGAAWQDHSVYRTKAANDDNWNVLQQGMVEDWDDEKRAHKASMFVLRAGGVARGYVQSVRMLDHYADNSGDDYDVDLVGMIREDRGAWKHLMNETNEAMEFVEKDLSLFLSSSAEIITYDEPSGQTETPDWKGAIGAYYSRSRGSRFACNTQYYGRPMISMRLEHFLLDNYDWPRKRELLFTSYPESGANVIVYDIAMGHYMGLARFFFVGAKATLRVEWHPGARLRPATSLFGGLSYDNIHDGYVRITPE